LAALAKPAVVQLQGLQKTGSGFFVTETGVIATNAQVARDEGSLITILPDGQHLAKTWTSRW
jgi:S1-C subfamily serine protease